MEKVEQYIKNYTRNCSNEYLTDGKLDVLGGYISRRKFSPWLTPDHARRAVEIAREEELEYIKYQLELRLPEILDYNGVQVDREDFINDFIKAMKDE